jgi:hypothetical protein
MNAYARLHLAATANAEASESRRPGAPTLRLDSPPDVLVAWLMWCDPNGTHTLHTPSERCAVRYACPCYADHAGERCPECGGLEPCPVCFGDEPAYETVDEVWEALADMLGVDLFPPSVG